MAAGGPPPTLMAAVEAPPEGAPIKKSCPKGEGPNDEVMVLLGSGSRFAEGSPVEAPETDPGVKVHVWAPNAERATEPPGAPPGEARGPIPNVPKGSIEGDAN